MVSMFRWFAYVLFLLLVVVGLAYFAAGRTTPPTLTIEQPTGLVGQQSTLQFTAGAPRAFFTRLEASLEQNGHTFPLFDLASPGSATVKNLDADHLQVTRPIGKVSLPELQQGPATITITATRDSLLRLR